MSPGSRRAVFLDRDGTVITDADYLADPDRVELIPGADDAIRRLKQAGWAVVMVTNQSGIARGLYTEADYRAVAARLDELLESLDASVDRTYYCPHHPDFSGPCECRKPGPRLYVQAARDLGLDLGASWYVGDKPSDVLPAVAMGGQGILVRTGYGAASVDRIPAGTAVVEDVSAAVDRILGTPRPLNPGTGSDTLEKAGEKTAKNRNDRGPFGYPFKSPPS